MTLNQVFIEKARESLPDSSKCPQDIYFVRFLLPVALTALSKEDVLPVMLDEDFIIVSFYKKTVTFQGKLISFWVFDDIVIPARFRQDFMKEVVDE